MSLFLDEETKILLRDVYNYENMSESAQRSYNRNNTIRKVALYISLACTVLLLIVLTIDSGGKQMSMALMESLILGGTLSGVVHGRFKFAKLFKDYSILGIVPFVFWLVFYSYAGFVFMIRDAILLFVKKQPLIYLKEHIYFYPVSETTYSEPEGSNNTTFYNINMMDDSQVAMDNLQKLNEMHEKGLISDKDYETKKAQLLERI